MGQRYAFLTAPLYYMNTRKAEEEGTYYGIKINY
nr:MAG TPA: hypothetical protein [Caudoviricetes sp.]